MPPTSLDDLLRAYVVDSSATLREIAASVNGLRTELAVHKSDDEHALRQIHRRLDELEDAQEETTDHAIEQLKEQAKGVEVTKTKALDVAIKVVGWAGALGVGWLAHHLFWK